SALGPLGLALGGWVIGGAAVDLWSRSGRSALGARLTRLRRLPRADWGRGLAHGGLGVTIIGIAGLLAWQQEDIRVAEIGDSWSLGRYEITLDAVRESRGPNYITTVGELSVRSGGAQVATLLPEKRFYPVAGMPTTEAGIDGGLWRDLYLVIGDPQEGGGWAMRSHVKPMAAWIWGGCILMALGGALSLTDRRMRVAAGARRAAPAPVAAQ
ncbi:heme lyase NrfEFG subunit NrfE, partial [Limimaricola sp. ASW11-118]